MKVYRHGDVVLFPCNDIPETVTKSNNLILAYGEVTGHKHQISRGLAELFEAGSVKYLKVIEEAALTHEEHQEIMLPKGNYKVTIQRTYRPDGWDHVKD